MAIDPSLLIDLSGEESSSVKRLFENGVIIPPQPRVLLEFEHRLESGVADVRDLSQIISQDPAIVATLFKVVRNAAFRKFQPFSSAVHILQAIGLQQTCNLMRAIGLASSLHPPQNRKAFEAYWSRSQAISDLAMLVAEERVSVCNIFPDQACLAGIFHDCGVPVLMQRFPTYCQDMHLEESGHWAELSEEDARFNVDHCVIGYLVAKHWRLPDFICDAIRFHHDIKRIENHASRTMVAILQLAIHIYSLDHRLANPEWSSAAPDVLDELGLSAESLPELVDVVLERYSRAA